MTKSATVNNKINLTRKIYNDILTTDIQFPTEITVFNEISLTESNIFIKN